MTEEARRAAFARIAAIVAAAQPLERPAYAEHARGSDRRNKVRRAAERPAPGPIDAAADEGENPATASDAFVQAGATHASPLQVADAAPDAAAFASAPPRNPDEDSFDLEATLADCAKLDHSDTDNGKRIIAYFGRKLTVRAESEVPGGSFLTWAGTHWDLDGGAAGANMLAQDVGPLIMREAEFLHLTPAEAKAIAGADVARAELKASALLAEGRREELGAIIAEGHAARKALSARKANRRKFGVSAKNSSRLANMLKEAAPHLRRPIEAFNAWPLKVATLSHTLSFVRMSDPECPDPDIERPGPAMVEAFAGHRREDLLTSVIPVRYDPAATAPKWTAFIERFQPIAATRRTVQQFTGLGLTGLPVQRFILHHGEGANGKSVFLETVTRVLGPSLAIGLPVESVTGNVQKSGSQAAPDIARLFGKRMVRILELPAHAALSVDVVKKLTGGEQIPVRTLFKGFFEFQPVCKPHFSTNGQPVIDDASNGIWRRMFPVEWPVTLAEGEQRDFEEVVREFVAEGAGILNWLIAGVLDFLEHGFVVSEGIREGTQAYRDDMDPTGPFVRDHIIAAPGDEVQAQSMYHAYLAWSIDAGRKPVTQTKFGLLMKHKVRRDDTKRRHRYVDVALHDVPELTPEMREKLGLGKATASAVAPAGEDHMTF
jgi:putative DNA primase/helicase